MDVVVLAGGLSPERDVSIASGCMVANALQSRGHKAVLVDLYAGADACKPYMTCSALPGAPSGEPLGEPACAYAFDVPPEPPDIDGLIARCGGRREQVGPGVFSLCRQASAVFLALHGGVGENGRIQAALDMQGIKYTGTGCLGSALAMDKSVSKELFRQNGVPTPDWAELALDGAGHCVTAEAATGHCVIAEAAAGRSVTAEAAGHGLPGRLMAFADKAGEAIGYPCVVKPRDGGSSIGVAIARSRAELMGALEAAVAVGCGAARDGGILCERMIEGREFTVGVLDGKALPVVEIVAGSGFFDYASKYQAGLTEEICPARIPGSLAASLSDAALKAHRALRLGSYSRIDFMADGDKIYCLEANTLPGLSRNSILPKMAQAAGIAYADLCERILGLAFRKEH